MKFISSGCPPEKLKLIDSACAVLKKRVERQVYEKSLLEFSEYVWPVVEPAIPMVRGWAMEAICEHLEAVTSGYIRRLLINVPPGFSKSLLTDVFWPAWIWGPCNRPWTRFMCASYSNHLTERDNMRCRNIVISDRYKAMWGHRFHISNEQFTKIKFANDQTGWKLATSVGGIGTGERADIVIIDDANNPMEMESEQVRRTTNMWFTEIMPDRLNNQKESAIVVIQQRTHEDDVSGVALSREMGYTHLCVPMLYVPRTYINGYNELGDIVTYVDEDAEGVAEEDIFYRDPRTEDGELAWPERFPQKIVEELERDKGPYAFAGQYQQTPEPRGGSIIKRDFWQIWKGEKYPPFEYILASLDTAYTEKKENDPSALTIFGVFREAIAEEDEAPQSGMLWHPRNGQAMQPAEGNPKIMLLYGWRGRLEFYELVQKVISICTMSALPKDTPSFPIDRLLIEGKASGLSVAQELYRLLGASGKFGIETVDPSKYGDKIARLHSVQHIFADKMVYAPDKAWADMVINEVSLFPKGSLDDLTDCVSMSLRWLRDQGFAVRREEGIMEREEDLAYRSPSDNRPLYQV